MNDGGKWVRSGEAVQLLLQKSKLIAPSTDLHRRLRAGMLRGKAERYEDANGVAADADLPTAFWSANTQFSHGAWASGDFMLPGQSAYGVWLEWEGLVSLCPLQFPPDPGPSTAWGTRRKDWWDDLWIEVARALHAGDLEPLQQTEIENSCSIGRASTIMKLV